LPSTEGGHHRKLHGRYECFNLNDFFLNNEMMLQQKEAKRFFDYVIVFCYF